MSLSTVTSSNITVQTDAIPDPKTPPRPGKYALRDLHNRLGATQMSPLRRHPVNKRKSASSFRNSTRRTKGANINGPQRGGWRM